MSMESTNTVRVAFYARVSGEEQTTGRNIEQQVAELQDSLPRSNCVVGVYKDDGVSGVIPLAERPEGARLMTDAAARRFEVVLATRLDRIRRIAPDLRQVAQRLSNAGVRLQCQTMVFGQDSMGTLFLNALGMIAEFERDLIKDRMLGGKRFKAKANGRWPGGTIPYGYGYDKGEPGKDGRWQIVEFEAEVVRRIYQMCVAENAGASIIADALTREGIPTPSAALTNPDSPRAKPKIRVGRTWERSQIARMLRNPTYSSRLFTAVDGERSDISSSAFVKLLRSGDWRKTGLIELRVPAIVDERLWWAAQDSLDARRKLPNRQHQGTWPLQARVTCASDDRGFKCRRNNKNGPRIYSCAARERRGLRDDARCEAPRLDAERLEAAVVWYVQGMLMTPKVGRAAVEDYLARLQALQDEAGKGLEPVRAGLNAVAEKAKRLENLYVWGHISQEDFQQQYRELAKTRETLEDEERQRQCQIDEFDSRRHDIERIRAAIADDRLGVSFLPSKGQLRVTLFKDDKAESQRKRTPNGVNKALSRPTTLRKGIESFDQATTEARFESPMELRRFFDLFDIKVVVHTHYVEVRGIFPNSIDLSLYEVDEVSSLHSRSASRRHSASSY